MKFRSLAGLTAAFFGGMIVAAHAQNPEIGKTEFRLRCAACHGADGTGGGMVGNLLKVPPPDLTRLAERNGGAFPFKRVYDIIDGRMEVAAHGTRNMPVWGDNYRAEQLPETPPASDATEAQIDHAERAVEANILAIVYYLGTIQAVK